LHAGSARQAALVSDLIEPLPTLLVDPLKVWLIRTGQLRVDEACEQGEKGVFLPEVGRRVWLLAWSTPMAETLASPLGHDGSHWKLPDGLVRSDVRFVDDPVQSLMLPRTACGPGPFPIAPARRSSGWAEASHHRIGGTS